MNRAHLVAALAAAAAPPPAAAFNPRGIVVHVSASTWGDVAEITDWHLARGFSTIGYHRVILNGRPKSNSRYAEDLDGHVERGRADSRQGAQCEARGMNPLTLGVCCIGNPGQRIAGAHPAPASFTRKAYLTERQLYALIDELAELCHAHGWDPEGTFKHPKTGEDIPVITQHSDHDPAKPFCASLNLFALREAVAAELDELRHPSPPPAPWAPPLPAPVEGLAPPMARRGIDYVERYFRGRPLR